MKQQQKGPPHDHVVSAALLAEGEVGRAKWKLMSRMPRQTSRIMTLTANGTRDYVTTDMHHVASCAVHSHSWGVAASLLLGAKEIVATAGCICHLESSTMLMLLLLLLCTIMVDAAAQLLLLNIPARHGRASHKRQWRAAGLLPPCHTSTP
jgi:hypothetical protein